MLEPDKASMNLIHIIESGKAKYKIVTTITGLAVVSSFRILENGNYNVDMTINPDEHEKGVDLDYFFRRPFGLVTQDGMRIFVNNHKVVSGSMGLDTSAPFKCNIEIKSFKGDADDSLWKNSRQRAYIKYNSKTFNAFSSGLIFDYTTASEDKGFYNAVLLKIEETELLFYHEQLGDGLGVFVIWPKKMIDFDVFQPMVSAIITAYGLLNGFYMLDSIYYITVKELANASKTSFYYENSEAAILSGNPILDSGNYPDVPEIERKMTSTQFNKLVNMFYKDQDYQRSGYLLIEAGSLNDTAKASMGAVALETITKKIGDKKTDSKIISDSSLISGIKHKLKKVLKEYNETLTKEQHQLLNTKIDLMNSMPSRNKLTSPFDQLGIALSEDELECIKSRNFFLHGNLPNNKNSDLTNQELLSVMANRLVMLSAMLLLKSAGYDGYVIDRGITEVIKWRMIMQGMKVQSGNNLRHIADPDHLIQKNK
ncbi:hypothetical protein [Sphingobacterium sp.]|uniref:hypothetical protein n=1 Tax=Sphingobacterium sp. TaxID=341027 RepID=UPI00289E9C5F|nr:hypothetical protein [Sphingobacterium sp.]